MEARGRTRLAIILLLSLILSGCQDGTEPPVVTTVIISGSTVSFSSLGQTAQFSARVLDQKGRTMADAPISWSASAPTIVGVSTTGLATALSNGTAEIRASSGSASGSKSLTVAQTPQALTKISGDVQTGAVGAELPTNLGVRVLDPGGAPIPAAQVTFAVTEGGGSLSTSVVVANSSGEASTRWTLGTVAGASQEASVTVSGLSAAFSAIAEAGPPATVSVLSGDTQTGYAMEPLPQHLIAQVADEYGNPTPNVQAMWASTDGTGSFSPTVGTTDSVGEVETEWTLGTTAGEKSATATVSGVEAASFGATALANAVISGKVSVTGGSLAPPAPTPDGDRAPARGRWQGATVEPESVPGELLVVFHEVALDAPNLGSGQYRAPDVADGVSGRMAAALETMESADRYTIAALSPAGVSARLLVEDEDLEVVAEALRRDPRVKAVEPNYIVRRPLPPSGASEATGPMTVSSTEEFYPLQAWHYEMIRLPRAWEITTGSQGVTVAVVDDGIRFDHSDLTANLTDDGFDFVTDDNIPVCSGGFVSHSGDGDGPDPDPTIPMDYAYSTTLYCVTGTNRYGGHGTHVAGTIGAVGTNGGGTGVNWDVSIRPVRVMGTTGSGTSWDVSQGIL